MCQHTTCLLFQAKAQRELGNFKDAYGTLDKALTVSRSIGDEAGALRLQLRLPAGGRPAPSMGFTP